MIKGSIKERLEYEAYIRSHIDNIYYPFEDIYQQSCLIRRYYNIQSYKRELTPLEKDFVNLMELIKPACHIGGVVYTWLWHEYLPQFILSMPYSAAEWHIDSEDIANIVLKVPMKTVEAVLLHAEVSRKVIQSVITAKCANDIQSLIELVSDIPNDSVFSAFKLIDSQIILWDNFSRRKIDESFVDKIGRYIISDSLQVTDMVEEITSQSVTETSFSLAYSIKSDKNGSGEVFSDYIFGLCMILPIIYVEFKKVLEPSDPILETLQLIIAQSPYQQISDQYIDFEKDQSKVSSFCSKATQFIHGVNLTSITENTLASEEIEDPQLESSKETMPHPVDYREYFASKAPNTDYNTMRDIAVRLAGKVKKGNGLVDTGMAYIKNEDVARLCYFFLHDIGKDDRDRNIDFTKPIWWIGDKWSLRYFITQLYKTGKLPSNLAKAVVEVFRFSDVERNHNEEKGKIAASSFQDTKKYLKNLRHEDVERINHILKEFGL